MADNNEDRENEVVAAGSSSGGGSNKLVMIVTVVNMLMTMGIVAALVLSHQKENSKPTVEDIVAGEASGGHGGAAPGGAAAGGHGGESAGGHSLTDTGKIIPLKPFTVNLTTGIGSHPRYVRMNISIELEKGVPDQEFDIKIPRVRDTVINLLNSKKASDINENEGRELIKDELKRAINSYMIQSKVKGVYFTNFAISQ